MATIPTLFCHTLRRRPSYAAVIPKLLAQTQYVVREELLKTHDIAVPISVEVDPQSGKQRPTSHLRFLLLSTSAVSDGKKEATSERIRHFAYLTAEPIAIIFLLNPPRETSFRSAKHFDQAVEGEDNNGVAGTLAYTQLQVEMMSIPDLPRIPILPLHTLDGLQALLQQHAARHMNRKSGAPRNTTTARDLLQLCSLQQPMKDTTANILSDTFVSLRDMAEAMVERPGAPDSSSPTAAANLALKFLSQPNDRWDANGRLHMSSEDYTPQGRLQRLKNVISEEEMADLTEFWRDEWQL
ncbi:hypothetical protein Slin14017_G036520 [Septoria linicola]|nr:hypothetical protein Slin14017_G036520 [Septoria linicola]